MIPKNLEKVNDYLGTWRGGSVEFNSFQTSMGFRFVIALNKDNESVSLMFAHCLYIQGPTSWKGCDLICSTWHDKEGQEGFEVKDSKAGFIVRGGGGISAGDGKLSVSVSE